MRSTYQSARTLRLISIMPCEEWSSRIITQKRYTSFPPSSTNFGFPLSALLNRQPTHDSRSLYLTTQTQAARST